MPDKNIHKGHRKRVKDNFLKNGLDNFEDHQILELLLFYALPQRDTNELAHKLISRFGSICGVFDAPTCELLKMGLSDNTVALLKLIPDISRKYIVDRRDNESKIIDTNDLPEYFKDRFIGRNVEVLYLLLIDSKGKEVYSGEISKGSINSTDVPTRKIVELTLLYNAKYVAIAHNHLSGFALPSKKDLITTQNIYNALKLINVNLIDHVIIAENDSISLRDSMYGTGIFVSNN